MKHCTPEVCNENLQQSKLFLCSIPKIKSERLKRLEFVPKQYCYPNKDWKMFSCDPVFWKYKTEIRVTMVHSYAALRELKEHTTSIHSYARLKSAIRKGKILAFITMKLFLRFLVCQYYIHSEMYPQFLICFSESSLDRVVFILEKLPI